MKKLILILSILVLAGAAVADDDDEGGVKQACLSDMTKVSGNIATIMIYDEISYQDVNLVNDLAVLEGQTEIRNVRVWVDSYGGLAHTGFAVADIINTAEKNGFTFTCRADGMVASIAVPIFLACDDRAIGPGTMFMVHEAQSANGQNTTRLGAEALRSMMELNTARYIDVLTSETKEKSRDKWEEWIRRTTWFNAERAVELGLAHRIE